MKFVHIADMHFGTSFSNLNKKTTYAQKRKTEQKNIFSQIINYIKENNIEHLFIAGDLYEHENTNISTIEYINEGFKQIPNTKIWITPGNHDPYVQNSYYKTYKWAENVHIFKGQIECKEEEGIDIYGYGFTDFYESNTAIENILLKNKNNINVLVLHADLDASKTEEKNYNPISAKKLQQIGFDYIALGHIHNTNFNEKERIIYPGSTICLGFDEIGKHGMVVRRNNKRKY